MCRAEVHAGRHGPQQGVSGAARLPVRRVFSIQQDFDLGYVIAPIDLTRKLLAHTDVVSSIEVYLRPDANMADMRDRIAEMLGDTYVVKDRYQQNELLYKIMKSEKWAVFLILAFILMVSIFNVIGSLTMLILGQEEGHQHLAQHGCQRAVGAQDIHPRRALHLHVGRGDRGGARPWGLLVADHLRVRAAQLIGHVYHSGLPCGGAGAGCGLCADNGVHHRAVGRLAAREQGDTACCAIAHGAGVK
jgi:hypothetical protein